MQPHALAKTEDGPSTSSPSTSRSAAPQAAAPTPAPTGAAERTPAARPSWVRVAPLLGMLVLLAVGLYQRLVPASDLVFSMPSEVRFLDSDSYYHLRHTQFAVAHFPHVQRFDVGTHYPRAQISEAAGLFDLTTAAVALLAGLGHPSERLVELVAAAMPVVLGLLSLLLLFGLVRRVSGAWPALIACLVATVFPSTWLDRTVLGYYDHHAAEVFLALASTWGATSCLFSARTGWRAWAGALGGAAPTAALVYTWAGGPIQIVLIGVAVLALLLLEVACFRGRPDLGRNVGRYGAALLLLVGVPGWLWPQLMLLSRIQNVVLAAIAALAVGPPLLLAVAGWLIRRRLRPGWAALLIVGALGLAIAVVVLVLLPSQSWMHLLIDRKVVWVQEHFAVTPSLYFSALGVPGLLALAAPGLFGWRVWRESRAAERQTETAPANPTQRDSTNREAAFVAVVGVLWLGLWIKTYDYNYEAPMWSAVLTGLLLGAVLRWRGGRARQARSSQPVSPRRLQAALLAGLAVITAAPWAFGAHRSPVLTADVVRSLNVYDEGWAQAMRWLSVMTPQPTLPVDAEVDRHARDFVYPPGTYGVIVNWSWGNLVAARGRRPPVASQGVFRASIDVADWLLMTDEDESIAVWEERCDPGEQIRYAIVDAETMGDHFVATASTAGVSALSFMAPGDDGLPRYGRPYLQTMGARLFFDVARELSHYRLVYQTPHQTMLYYRAATVVADGRRGTAVRLHSDPVDTPEDEARYNRLAQGGVVRDGDERAYGAMLVPSIRIFEIVPGATVVGTAPPGARVRARLQLRSRSDGAQLGYERTAEVDAQGHFALTVPYSTDGRASSNVGAMGRYQFDLVVDGHAHPARQVAVSEERVQSGTPLDIGELRL